MTHRVKKIIISFLLSLIVFFSCSNNKISNKEPIIEPNNEYEELTTEEKEHDSKIINSNKHYEIYVLYDKKWRAVRVRDALCSNADKHAQIWNDWNNNKKLRDTMSYCIFEHSFNKPVKVRIKQKTNKISPKNISSIKIRPSTWNIPHTLLKEDKNMIEIEIPSFEHRKLSIEFNDDIYHNLFLIPHKPDQNKPCKNDPNVKFFAPGIHNFKEPIKLNDGETLYLDHGAVLNALVEINGNNCTIAGHGILSGSTQRHWGSMYSNGEIMIKCNKERKWQKEGLNIKDITIVDGPSWNLSAWNFNKINIDGVNIIDWELNGDGIDITCCKDVSIKNCLIRTYDDCITLKLRHNIPRDGIYVDTKNVKIQNNLIWNDYARGIVIGPEAGNKECGTGKIHNIEIDNCIFLEHKRGEGNDDVRAAFAIGQVSSPTNGTPTNIEDIYAHNLTFDNISKTGRNIWFYQYPNKSNINNKIGSLINNIKLENIKILNNHKVVTPILTFTTNGNTINNVNIKNITLDGKKIKNNDNNIKVDSNVNYSIE